MKDVKYHNDFFSNPEPLEHGKCKFALFGSHQQCFRWWCHLTASWFIIVQLFMMDLEKNGSSIGVIEVTHQIKLVLKCFKLLKVYDN